MSTQPLPSLETAYVVSVPDADGLNVLTRSGKIRIRINHIDAPEDGQPHAYTARQFLLTECLHTYIQFHAVKSDQYGRTIANVLTNEGYDLAALMLQNGHAWHYRKFSRDTRYAQLERSARDNKIGLWCDPTPEPPWQYRKRMKGIKKK